MTYFQNICLDLKPQRKSDMNKASRNKKEEGEGVTESGRRHLWSQLGTLCILSKVL